MADGKMIEYRVDNGIAVLEINRPPVNSYTTELLKELDAAILEARFDDNVHAIVLTGKIEKFFSAGADINMLSSTKSSRALKILPSLLSQLSTVTLLAAGSKSPWRATSASPKRKAVASA